MKVISRKFYEYCCSGRKTFLSLNLKKELERNREKRNRENMTDLTNYNLKLWMSNGTINKFKGKQ